MEITWMMMKRSVGLKAVEVVVANWIDCGKFSCQSRLIPCLSSSLVNEGNDGRNEEQNNKNQGSCRNLEIDGDG